MPSLRAGKDDGPVAFRFSLPWSGDPLLDDLTAKVGVDLAHLGTSSGPTQDRIRNPFSPGKALKPRGFEDSQAVPDPFYSTRCHSSRAFALLISKTLAVFLAELAMKFKRRRVVVILNFWFAVLVTWNLAMIVLSAFGVHL
jgi:hypothetical protein